MTPDGSARAGSLSCWNCAQPLPAGSARCLYCGVPQDAPSAQLVVAPYGVVGAGPIHHSSVPYASGGWDAAPALSSALGDEFAGRPAGVGPRLAALSIDAAVVAAVVAATAVLTASVPLAVLVLAELAVGLWVLQARTGAGPGTALLRLRVSRSGQPFSPGLGRAAVRGLVTAAGAVVFLVGAWAVEASAAWDRSQLRRSWADRAAGTVVVAMAHRERPATTRMPARRVVPAPGEQGALPPARAQREAVGAAPPTGMLAGTGTGYPLALAGNGPAGLTDVVEDAVPLRPPLPVPVASPDTDSVVPEAPRYRRRTAIAAAPDEAVRADIAPVHAEGPRAGDAPVDAEAVGTVAGERLLLIFDTGQREQLPLPVSANLGRNPAASLPTDAILTVRDPDQTVSKTHARLEQTRTGLWLIDNGSRNGTDLIDEAGLVTTIEPGVRTLVDDGVRVRLGNRVFTISRLQDEV